MMPRAAAGGASATRWRDERRAGAISIALALVAVAACGGGDDAGSGSQATPGASATSPVRDVTCAELPPGLLRSASIQRRYRAGEPERYELVYLEPGTGEVYLLVVGPQDDPAACDGFVQRLLALANNPAVYDAARRWVEEQQGGELVGPCRPELAPGTGPDPSRDDLCFFLSTHDDRGIEIVAGRPMSDDTYSLALELQPGGDYAVIGVTQPGP